jgi:hypothetical protein
MRIATLAHAIMTVSALVLSGPSTSSRRRLHRRSEAALDSGRRRFFKCVGDDRQRKRSPGEAHLRVDHETPRTARSCLRQDPYGTCPACHGREGNGEQRAAEAKGRLDATLDALFDEAASDFDRVLGIVIQLYHHEDSHRS